MSIKSFNGNQFFMDTLQKYKDKPSFEIPEHYFKQLQHDVMQRVIREGKQQKKQKKWISVISVAASISLIIIFSYFLFVNRNFEEHFYVFDDFFQQDDTMVFQDSSYLVEGTETDVEEFDKTEEKTESPISKNTTETIVYRAVDFYVDDYETYNFCEVMYDLECFYDY